jgi:hypothetical protein
MSEDLKAMIVRDLVKQRDRNDIIEAVCEQGGLDWQQSEELVQQVETEQAHAIARGQTPLMIFLSVGTVAIGMLFLAYSIQILKLIFRANPLAGILLLASNNVPLAVGVIGLAMIAGGMIGMWKMLSRYFET